MKIIVTERQLEIFRLIKENEDVINKFKNRFNKISKDLNILYQDIQFINVGNLVDIEPNMDSNIIKVLLNRFYDLDTKNSEINREVTNFINSKSEDDYEKNFESMHYDIEKNYYYKNSRKINVISAILMNLEKLVDDLERLVNQHVDDRHTPDAFEDMNVG